MTRNQSPDSTTVVDDGGEQTAAATPEAPRRPAPLSHSDVLAVSIPIILSNLTTPLIGMADTAVLGRLDRPDLIGAAALGATIFSILYWGFAFLRMGTTGLTAQAEGAGDGTAVVCTLGRALLIAGLAGAALIVLQAPVIWLALQMLGGSDAVQEGTRAYFGMRIWGAPAALANFALFGWLVGLGRAKAAFAIQLLLNGLNIALAILFGLGLGMTVRGVGLAAALADAIAAGVGLWLAWRQIRGYGVLPSWTAVVERAGVRRMLAINGDIMVRTLCVQLAFSFFTAQMAAQGDVALAANAILMQLVTLAAYMLDGFAFSAETLVGKSIGARDEERFLQAARISTLWAALCGLATGIVIWTAGGLVIDFLTVSATVRAHARHFLVWAALGPVVGFACYQLDGIFIGATRTRDMRDMMLLSVAVYLVMAVVLPLALGMHGLWLALLIFYAVRAWTLYRRLPALRAHAFGTSARQLEGEAACR